MLINFMCIYFRMVAINIKLKPLFILLVILFYFACFVILLSGHGVRVSNCQVYKHGA